MSHAQWSPSAALVVLGDPVPLECRSKTRRRARFNHTNFEIGHYMRKQEICSTETVTGVIRDLCWKTKSVSSTHIQNIIMMNIQTSFELKTIYPRVSCFYCLLPEIGNVLESWFLPAQKDRNCGRCCWANIAIVGPRGASMPGTFVQFTAKFHAGPSKSSPNPNRSPYVCSSDWPYK